MKPWQILEAHQVEVWQYKRYSLYEVLHTVLWAALLKSWDGNLHYGFFYTAYVILLLKKCKNSYTIICMNIFFYSLCLKRKYLLTFNAVSTLCYYRRHSLVWRNLPCYRQSSVDCWLSITTVVSLSDICCYLILWDKTFFVLLYHLYPHPQLSDKCSIETEAISNEIWTEF